MISAFVNRRPWIAGLIALVLGPVVGMLYIGRGRLAISYLGAFLVMIAVPLLAGHLGLLPIEAETVMTGFWVAYRLGGAIHCANLAPSLVGERPGTWFARWYIIVAAGVFLPVAVPTYLWEPFDLPSRSMEPTMQAGDYFLVSKSAYRFSAPERGDLVVFLKSGDDEMPYLKRLIGLPGDRVQMIGGVLHINDRPVDLESLPEKAYRETLPDGRSYLIRKEYPVGPYHDTEAYDVPPGHYFLLGDNRDNSMDSRTLNIVGYVPAENLIGRVAMVVWNSERQKLLFLEGD